MLPPEAAASRPALPATPPAVDVQLSDTLASANRLWVRGRLVIPSPPRAARKRGWWKRWRRAAAAAPPPLQMQTQIGGDTLAAEVPVRPDGYFEATFEAALPPARRGWRVARHHITVGEQTLRACSVVLTPPAGTGTGGVVVLPLAFTHEPGVARRLSHSPLAARLTEWFRTLPSGDGARAIYYLCCVPPGAPNLQPELALAATSLGWPSGHFVLLPAPRDGAAAALREGLDRLRWLFADQLDFLVVNREPAAEADLAGAVSARGGLAPVSRYVGADADLRGPVPAGDDGPHVLVRRGPRPTRLRCVPQYPVVFCHGMLAMTMLRMQIPEDTNYFSHLRPFFAERGVSALYPNVAPTGGVAARAEELRDQIRRWTGEPVNVIAHSMGGLDARFLITRLGMADRVRSLTTVATPHHGSALADWFCLNFRQRLPLLLTLEAFGINVDGFQDCRIDACRAFNEATPDAPGVRYFSYNAAVPLGRVSPLLRRSWNLLTQLDGPNDGLVSRRSGSWGEVLGTLAVDHFAQTPDGLFVRPGETFDALGFYSRLIEDLAHRGL